LWNDFIENGSYIDINKVTMNKRRKFPNTINRQYIDRFRKIEARGGPSNRELSDEQWEEEMVIFAVGSPSALVQRQESVKEVLAVLTDKEREILIMAAAGYDNHDIANYLNYRTNKIVATRLQQIRDKVRNALT
jgi:DNA-binding NarL/FixJ family response regulator